MSELKVSFGGYSTSGIKDENEDAFAACQPSASVRRRKGVVAVIADGVSASAGAQKASHTAVTTFIDDFLATPESWTTRLAAARVIRALNRWLYQHGRDDASLVTTLTALVVKSTTAHVLHVGDSRVWLWREGMLRPLTRDHRLGRRQFLTRALGMDMDLEVDYLTEDLQSNDVVMLTTDGVHDWLTTEAMALPLRGRCLETAARAVVEAALAAGSDDNASCLLARVDALPVETIEEAHRRLTERIIPPALQVGSVLDGYRVRRVLHQGPRSHLYLVEDEHGEALAMKVPSVSFADDPVYLEAFLREEWIGRRLHHHGIVGVHPGREGSRFLYTLLEYIPGQTLRQWIYDHPNAPLPEVRRIVEEITLALRAMQRMQMVHRDLKPENVMIDQHGRARIVDLGTVYVAGFDESASAIREDAPAGSVGYVAPERLAGQPATHLSDLFSLGVVTYEMLTGALPYRTPVSARDPASYRRLTYIPATSRRSDVPPWLDMTLERAVAPRPERRYAAFSEFLTDLSRPNEAMMRRRESAPLVERDPVLFWKLTSLVLLGIAVAAALV